MKLHTAMVPLLFLVACACARGQGPFAYDQQSSTDEGIPRYGEGGTINQLRPLGQSFTPALSEVGFVRLKLNDGNRLDGLGATVYLHLRSDSIGGPILGATVPVTMPSQFRGNEDFFFADGVPVVPGVMYYIEVIEQSGGPWNISAASYNYQGGTTIVLGKVLSGSDLWFREGIVIPEPAAGGLLLFGLAGLLACRRARSSPQAL